MTVHNNCEYVILTDGRVIICKPNGYKVRTLESDFGKSVTDSYLNFYGPAYWRKQAMKELGVSLEDMAMQIKGRVIFND